MKQIVSLLLALLIAAAIAGCGVEKEPLQYKGRMQIAADESVYQIWIDTETGVCYIRTLTGSFVVMVDHTGMPYIANGWRDWSDGDELY